MKSTTPPRLSERLHTGIWLVELGLVAQLVTLLAGVGNNPVSEGVLFLTHLLTYPLSPYFASFHIGASYIDASSALAVILWPFGGWFITGCIDFVRYLRASSIDEVDPVYTYIHT